MPHRFIEKRIKYPIQNKTQVPNQLLWLDMRSDYLNLNP